LLGERSRGPWVIQVGHEHAGNTAIQPEFVKGLWGERKRVNEKQAISE
jgi:hypothetical protein